MVLFGGLPLVGNLYLTLLFSQSEKLKLYGMKITREASGNLLDKWFPLYHVDDEALGALQWVRTAKISLFDSKFAVSALSFMSLISVPAIMYALSQLEIYESFAAQIGKWVPLTPTPEPGNLEAFARNNLTVIAYPTVYILQLLEWTGVTPGSRAILNSALVVGWLLGFFGLWLASVLVNLSVVLLSQNVSSMLSRFFNRIAHSQIRTNQPRRGRVGRRRDRR